jgi:general secretion pathway protein D
MSSVPPSETTVPTTTREEQDKSKTATTPPPVSQDDTAERSIDISGKVKAESSSNKAKAPNLPSLQGKIRTGLLGLPPAAEPEGVPSPGKEKQRILLNFEKAEIAEVTSQIFGGYLKLNYVLDPTLQGHISLYLEGEYASDEMFQMITKAYEANNVSIVPRNGIYYLQPVQRSSSSSLPVADSLMLKADKEGAKPVIVMYRLRYMDAKQAINTIKFFLAPGRPITSDTMTNTIIFVEDTDNARTIVSVLQALDINFLQEVSMEIIPVKSISPQDACQSMEALIGKLDFFKDSGLKGNVAYLPLQNFGGVLVLARSPELIKTAKYWLTALDIEGAEAGDQIHVHFIQNGLATDIGAILNQVFGLKGAAESRPEQKIVSSTSASGSSSKPFGSFGGSSGFGRGSSSSFGGSSGSSSSFGSSSGLGSSGSSSSGAGTKGGGAGATGAGAGRSKSAARVTGAEPLTGLTGEVIIIPDEVNNAIVIRANALDYAKIKKTIETLDIIPRAVLIEVMVAEITLNKDLEYGVQWFLNQGDVKAAFEKSGNKFSFKNSELTGSGLGLLFKSGDDFAALLKLLASKTDVQILATPTLLATDNKEAAIQVGGREPVPTGSYSSTDSDGSVLSTISYEETGTILNVTPHINAGGLVRLEVEQTIRRVGNEREVGDGSTAPSFIERNLKTTLLAQNGSTVVIGGIIDETQQNEKSGIPFLQDIPVISPLFSNKSRSMERTELIIGITPHVVSNRETDVTRELMDKLRQLKSRIGK